MSFQQEVNSLPFDFNQAINTLKTLIWTRATTFSHKIPNIRF